MATTKKTERIQPKDNPLAHYLYQVMRQRDWSARQFSLKAGLHPGQIALTLQTGRAAPETCRKIARFLGLPENHVLELGGHSAGPPGEAEGEVDPEALAELRRLPRDQQKLVVIVAAVIAREGLHLRRDLPPSNGS